MYIYVYSAVVSAAVHACASGRVYVHWLDSGAVEGCELEGTAKGGRVQPASPQQQRACSGGIAGDFGGIII